WACTDIQTTYFLENGRRQLAIDGLREKFECIPKDCASLLDAFHEHQLLLMLSCVDRDQAEIVIHLIHKDIEQILLGNDDIIAKYRIALNQAALIIYVVAAIKLRPDLQIPANIWKLGNHLPDLKPHLSHITDKQDKIKF